MLPTKNQVDYIGGCEEDYTNPRIVEEHGDTGRAQKWFSDILEYVEVPRVEAVELQLSENYQALGEDLKNFNLFIDVLGQIIVEFFSIGTCAWSLSAA